MAIPAEVKKTIEIINERIESLLKLRDSLMREFGLAEALTERRIEDKQLSMPISIPVWKGTKKTTRKQQVIDFIASHGPRSRREIAQGVGIPEGTVSFVLNDKATFMAIGGGKWDVLPAGTPAPTSESSLANQ